MKRIKHLEEVLDLFEFKTVVDNIGNEYVLFKQNVEFPLVGIQDKTQFEALDNHIHIFDNIKKDEYDRLLKLAPILGQSVLAKLSYDYPDKKFVVFITICLHDSIIIRFHQKWENEEYYYNHLDYTSKFEKVFMFEN